MARRPKMARGKISLVRCTHCCPNFFYSFCPTRVSVLWRICVYIHTWLRTDCIRITVATKEHWSKTFLHKWGAVRSIEWIFIIAAPVWQWISGIGRKVLQSPFQTGSGSSPSYFQIFFLIALREGAFFIRNISTHNLMDFRPCIMV
jgi:hypothetical protein